MQVLADQSAAYLIKQIDAGADVVHIFDSWSGVLDDASFEAFCVRPVAEIVRRVRIAHPDVPIIGFPKGGGANYATYRQRTGATALGVDGTVPLSSVSSIQLDGAVQGNLDPLRLVAGGKALADGVENILKSLRKGPFVFNLGHGIVPETPIENVWAMVKQVRNG